MPTFRSAPRFFHIVALVLLVMVYAEHKCAYAKNDVPLADSDPGTSSNPNNSDTDGDGYGDGPDILIRLNQGTEYEQLMWRLGEDKNANGKYEPKGQDGVLGTDDDEFDPNNPSSHPMREVLVPYEDAAKWHDADGDGLTDAQEDTNLNGVVDPGETDFRDADTDDDGLSDGFESGLATPEKLPFLYSDKLDPLNPDSDGDGLPDGLELGVKKDASGLPLTLAGTYDPHYGGRVLTSNPYVDGHFTDLHATFTYSGQPRSCFVAAPEGALLTDPSSTDTNSDGHEDGEGVTIDDHGNVDFAGHTPGAGLVAHVDACTPTFYFDPATPAIVRPLKSGDTMDPQGIGTNILKFVYQTTEGEVLNTQSIHISNPNAFTLMAQPRGIENIGGNFYVVRLSANTTLTAPQSSTVQVVTNKGSSSEINAKAERVTQVPWDEYKKHLLQYTYPEGYDSQGVNPVNKSDLPSFNISPDATTWFKSRPVLCLSIGECRKRRSPMVRFPIGLLTLTIQ